jgi:hypothetical protein
MRNSSVRDSLADFVLGILAHLSRPEDGSRARCGNSEGGLFLSGSLFLSPNFFNPMTASGVSQPDIGALK